MKTTKIKTNYIFYFILFTVVFVFFSIIHPIVIFDTDDWGILVLERPAFPKVNLWNPTKILPECLGPLVACIAAYFVNPIIGDYMSALIFTNAFLVSLFIIAYLISIQKLLEYRFQVSKTCVYGIIIIYTLLHFLILKIHPNNNDYLWYSHDYNCYYHYIIPNLLCSCIVLWLMRHNIHELKDMKQWAIFIIVNYLALCSNLFATVILIAYIGAYLIININKHIINRKFDIISYISNNIIYLIIVVFWLAIQWIESHGHRATSYGHLYDPIFENIILVIKELLKIRINAIFLIFSVLILLFTKLYNIYSKEHKIAFVGEKQIIIIVAFVLTLVYQLILCSRVEIPYILRADVIFSFAFFFLLLLILCFTYLCKKIPLIKVSIPFVIFFIFFEINTKENTFKEIMYEHNYSAQSCLDFNRNIIQQIKKAEQAGQDTVIIKIPKFEEEDNWPLISDSGDRVGIALYKHNVIKKKIVTIYEIQ